MAWHQRGSGSAPRGPRPAHTVCSAVEARSCSPSCCLCFCLGPLEPSLLLSCHVLTAARQLATGPNTNTRALFPAYTHRSANLLLDRSCLGRFSSRCACLGCSASPVHCYPLRLHTPNTPNTPNTQRHTPLALWNFLPFMCFLTASTDLSISCPVSAQYSISLGRHTAHSTQHANSPQHTVCLLQAGERKRQQAQASGAPGYLDRGTC